MCTRRTECTLCSLNLYTSVLVPRFPARSCFSAFEHAMMSPVLLLKELMSWLVLTHGKHTMCKRPAMLSRL